MPPPDPARRRSSAVLPRRRRPGAAARGALGAGDRRRGPHRRGLGATRQARASTRPRLFAAYLHTLRWNCVTATDPSLFQSPFRAGIRIDAYQLEPLRKALRLPRVNLFIADDVGLGKTIEAGLIARELLLRKQVRDIVVACPPSMLLQWQEELEQRFGLSFEILDRDYVDAHPPRARLRRQPLDAPTRASSSRTALLIDEAYAGAAARLARATSRPRLAADPRRGPPRRPVQRRQVRHRLADHPGHPRPAAAVRASAVPLGDAAQRPLQQLLGAARDPRSAALLPRRAGRAEAARRRHGAAAQGGPPRSRGRLPEAADRRRSTSTASPRTPPSLRSARAARRVPERARAAPRGAAKPKQAAAGLLIVGLQQRLLSSDRGLRTARFGVHRRDGRAAVGRPQASRRRRRPAPRGPAIFSSRRPRRRRRPRRALAEDDLEAEEDAGRSKPADAGRSRRAGRPCGREQSSSTR